MHFLFIGAIGRHAPPSVAASETSTASTGVHKVSRALANVLNIYAKDNLNGLFCKIRLSVPFPELALTREKRGAWAAPAPRAPRACT